MCVFVHACVQAPAPGNTDQQQGEQVVSPPLSSHSSDQISSRTQVSVGVGPNPAAGGGGGGGGGGGNSDSNRPNSGGTSKAPGNECLDASWLTLYWAQHGRLFTSCRAGLVWPRTSREHTGLFAQLL